MNSVVIVAQRYSSNLTTQKWWVQILRGAGLFFSLSLSTVVESLMKVPRGGATLLIFLFKICGSLDIIVSVTGQGRFSFR